MRKKHTSGQMPVRKRLNRRAIHIALFDQGRTAASVALEIGISSPYLQDMLHDRRNATAYVSAIAKALGMTEAEITLPCSSAAEQSLRPPGAPVHHGFVDGKDQSGSKNGGEGAGA